MSYKVGFAVSIDLSAIIGQLLLIQAEAGRSALLQSDLHGCDAMASWEGLVKKSEWTSLIKQLNAAISETSNVPLLLNRAACHAQLGLLRKALKDYDTVLELDENNTQALIGSIKVLIALKDTDAARKQLKSFILTASCTTDINALIEAQHIADGLEQGSITKGTKLSMFSAIAAQSKTTATTAESVSAPKQPSSNNISSKESLSSVSKSVASTQTDGGSNGSSSSSTEVKANSNQQQQQTQPIINKTSKAAVDAKIDPMHRLLAVSNADAAVGTAVDLVNSGKHEEAVVLLDLILERHGNILGALAARGTARALINDLQGAVDDFSVAIDMEPRIHDLYKRRSQALGALGDHAGAGWDLTRAVSLSPDNESKLDAYVDLARVSQKRQDHVNAEIAARAGLAISPDNHALLRILGTSLMTQGNLDEAIATYATLLKMDPNDAEALLGAGMAYKEMCRVDEAQQYLEKAAKAGGERSSFTAFTAYKLSAQLLHGLGQHAAAAKKWNAALKEASTVAQRIEATLMRGSCHHTLGNLFEAVADYHKVLEMTPDSNSEQETVQHMCLAFYQKEVALWEAAHLGEPVTRISLDIDIIPEFKEQWAKKSPPHPAFISMYQRVMQPQQPNWSAIAALPLPDNTQLAPLSTAADAIGKLVQYRQNGFLPNKRQQRMAGFAAIEFGQLISSLATAKRQGVIVTIPNAGASVTARTGSKKGSHEFGWRDAMESIVKWRQLAEPNDQVIWVDLLTEREFNNGFGSHTPIFTGQTKCVRYYANFERALSLAKQVMKREGKAMDADNKPIMLDSESVLKKLDDAKTAKELWEALGKKDAWVVVPITSTTRQGHELDGTRLTVVKLNGEHHQKGGIKKGMSYKSLDKNGAGSDDNTTQKAANGQSDLKPPSSNGTAAEKKESPTPAAPMSKNRNQLDEPDSFEFSIRTPVTPARWKDYDTELTGVFSTLIDALASGDIANVKDSALRFAYYWYNFMPLARGSAFCGYVSLLGVFMAAGIPVTTRMPERYQTDWEAILEGTPEAFIASVSRWMLDCEKSSFDQGVTYASLDELPAVGEVLGTMHARIHALNC